MQTGNSRTAAGKVTTAAAPIVTAEDQITETLTLDACGLQCPGPIMQTYQTMDKLTDGDVLFVKASDPGFAQDIRTWANNTGNTVLKIDQDAKTREIHAYIQKGTDEVAHEVSTQKENKGTIVLFSGELDKAMAAMIIAQGAAATGKQMTVFCTFWGLNLLRRDDAPKVEKSAIESMFGMMMPKGAEALPLSNMNMGGMGKTMMKKVMKDKNVDSLPQLLKQAQEVGVRFIACTMSMDVMGIKEEELIDGIELGGVATYVGESTNADLTLFI
ncbi:MAG: DsrE/DsrF/DrsH-like family protein [Culicoidibacterales bacterium]